MDFSNALRETADSLNNVGDEYYNEGKFLDAVTWYTKAAKDGNAYAMNNLGIMYENGKGVSKNLIRAKEWYKEAKKAGYTP